MRWKYAMMLVKVDEITLKEECELVKLYDKGDGDGFSFFYSTKLLSSEELLKAAKDVETDGTNKWFYNNGTFTKNKEGVLSWEKLLPLDKALIDSGELETYEDEIELYTIYGGD
jgi:hypothetical protein